MRFIAISRAAFLTLALASLFACGTEDPVTKVDENDADMLAATARSRATVDEFIKKLRAPAIGTRGVRVKYKCVDGDKVESVWLGDVSFDNDKFTGFIDTTPEVVTKYKLGQMVRVAKDEIADWMYVEYNELIGGYTYHAMYLKMSTKEREKFDKSHYFKLPANPKP